MSVLFVQIFTAALSAMSPLTCAPSPGRKDTEVFYYYLFVDTAVPINEKSIRDRGFDLTSVVRDKVPDILEALSKSDGWNKTPSSPDKFNANAVRLLIVPPGGKPILMDRYGYVRGPERSGWLSVDARKELRLLIFSAFPDG